MFRKKKSYDLIFSLGGSCATSKQLRLAKLQFLSLPFDWIFHTNDRQLLSLKEGFENNFIGWLDKENLSELKGDERGQSDKYQYKNKQTGFGFIHDFNDKIDVDHSYQKVVEKYEKRFLRLHNILEKSKRVLLVLDAEYILNQDYIHQFIDVLSLKYPTIRFDIITVSFNTQNDDKHIEDYKNAKIHHISYKRKRELIDFSYKNKEWNFLKDIKLSWYGENILQKQWARNICDIGKVKKRFHLYMFKGYLPNILRFQLMFLSLKFDFSFGYVKG